MLLDKRPNSLPTPPTPYMHKTRTFYRHKILHSAWLVDTASCRGGSVANRLHLSACILNMSAFDKHLTFTFKYFHQSINETALDKVEFDERLQYL